MENRPISPVSVVVFSIPSKAFGMLTDDDRASEFAVEAPSRRSRWLRGRASAGVEMLVLRALLRARRVLTPGGRSIVHILGGYRSKCGWRSRSCPNAIGGRIWLSFSREPSHALGSHLAGEEVEKDGKRRNDTKQRFGISNTRRLGKHNCSSRAARTGSGLKVYTRGSREARRSSIPVSLRVNLAFDKLA